MRGSFFKGIVLGSATAVLALMAASAFAGTGVGGVFNLGKRNTVDRPSSLIGSTGLRMLTVTNQGTGTALRLNVQPGAPPMRVNSNAVVPNLNADSIDGIDSTGLILGTGSIVQARLEEPADGANRTVLAVPGFGTVEASCDSGDGFRVFWRNSSGTTLDAWKSLEGTTTYSSIANGSGIYVAFDITADRLTTLQVGHAGHTATVTTSAHWTSGGCVFHSQATAQ